MATTPNAQLTKLALGIAGVAAIAGISGKIAAGTPVAAQQPTATIADAGASANGRTQLGTQPGGDQQYQSPLFFGDDDEEEGEGEHEHDGARSFFGAAPTQPQSGTLQQPQQQLPTRRTRSKHS